MTKQELKHIYDAECASRRITPQADELAKWVKAVLHFEKCDVERGVDLWNADRKTDSGGQLKSKWMPTPVELTQCVERAYSTRIARASEHKEEWSWDCPVCGNAMSGFLAPGANTKRFCRSIYGPIGTGKILCRGTICGHDMTATRFETYDKAEAKRQRGAAA